MTRLTTTAAALENVAALLSDLLSERDAGDASHSSMVWHDARATLRDIEQWHHEGSPILRRAALDLEALMDAHGPSQNRARQVRALIDAARLEP